MAYTMGKYTGYNTTLEWARFYQKFQFDIFGNTLFSIIWWVLHSLISNTKYKHKV